MKKISMLLLLVMASMQVNSQILKKIEKRATKAAEETVVRKVETKTAQKTGEAMDEVLNAPEKSKKNKNKNKDKSKNSGPEIGVAENGQQQEIVTGSSFFPDGEVFYKDDFSRDALGDFPANWDTNAGGEVITIDGEKAFRFYPNSMCMTQTGKLPDNYALEFDFTTANLDYKNLSGASFRLHFVEENQLNVNQRKRSEMSMSLWEGSSEAGKIYVQNFGSTVQINNRISFNMEGKFNNTVHFTVVVNKKRLRVFIDNQKAVDLPSFLHDDVGRYVQFYLKGTDPDLGHVVAISNVKFLREGEDLRSLILKGGFSTTEILFDSGSDKIKRESYGFLDRLGKVLVDDPELKVAIIGHTDSDGDDASNLELSKQRAAAVRYYLVQNFDINGSNVSTDGKGETEPVADNNSEDGKAKNRRVEIKKTS